MIPDKIITYISVEKPILYFLPQDQNVGNKFTRFRMNNKQMWVAFKTQSAQEYLNNFSVNTSVGLTTTLKALYKINILKK